MISLGSGDMRDLWRVDIGRNKLEKAKTNTIRRRGLQVAALA